MLQFLKKRGKSFKKPVPPGGLAHQITDTGVERGRDPEGEYNSRKISADKADGG